MVKICGLTRLEDAMVAARSGATAIGFVFWPKSPRAVTTATAAAIAHALPPDVMTVGVFVDESPAAMRLVAEQVGLTALQLHGSEPASYATALGRRVMKAVGVDDAAALDGWPADTLILLDAMHPVARGGTGTRVDWDAAAAVARQRPVVLAGGLTPDNVHDAVVRVRPYGVDVSSGVEQSPGVKDEDKVRRFVAAARQAFAELGNRGER